MGTIFADRFRAGTEAGDRYFDANIKVNRVGCLATDKTALVVHHALGPGDRSLFLYEIVKGYLQMSKLSSQVFANLTENSWEYIYADLFMVFVDDLDKAAHVSSLEVVWEADVYVERSGSMLDTVGSVENRNRVFYPFDANLVDVNLAVVLHLLGIVNTIAHTCFLVRI